MNTLDSFSDTYQQARDKFVDAASRAAGELEKFWHPELGPDGSKLSTDVAWLGPRDAERVLLMISGYTGDCSPAARARTTRDADLSFRHRRCARHSPCETRAADTDAAALVTREKRCPETY